MVQTTMPYTYIQRDHDMVPGIPDMHLMFQPHAGGFLKSIEVAYILL